MTTTSTAPTGPSRLRLTGYAAAQFGLAVPCLLVFVLTGVAASVAVIVIGLVLLVALIPVINWLADRHRAMAGSVLGLPIPNGRRSVEGLSVGQRLRVQAGDPMVWREWLWLLVTFVLSLTISLLVLLLFLLVVTGIVWWWGVEPLMRLRSLVDRALLGHGTAEVLEQRVQVLTETRSDSLDHSAAELRRIERDLHDGAQARLAALNINLGMAADLFERDPASARALIDEARTTTGAALGDIRSVVRGIHPPMLADRGLSGAVESLALDLPIPVEVTTRFSGRPTPPIESAVYFAIAECLANVVKHAQASAAWVTLDHHNGVLAVIVGDDGRGGADPGSGSGMRGVMRRLASFDGTMRVSSPDRGPTIVRLEVPCVLPSPKTTPSSGTV